MDNFGGAAAWDAYCSRQEASLRRAMETIQCKNCGNFDSDNNICLYGGDEVDPEKYAIEYECEQVVSQ